MNNCKDIEQLIVDYIDGNLNSTNHLEVKQHINNCESCRKVEHEYRLLFKTISNDTVEYPRANLRDTFGTNLSKEESSLKQILDSKPTKPMSISLYSFYKIAAVLLLMFGSYWFGNYNSKKVYASELVNLNIEKQELKTIAALSLFESESASKRIQAVEYSQELDNPDDGILKALINEMLHDKLVNVRLASARALERFSEYDAVKDAFIEALKSEENTNMQIELIEILAHIKEKRAIPKMRELLQDSETPSYLKDQINLELKQII